MSQPASHHSTRHLLDPNWWLLGLLTFSCCINYIDRGNLSIAAPQLLKELSLNPAKLGLLLSAFFWTYAAFQVVGGWLVDRFDVYRVYGVGFLLWSAATALTGFAGGFATLFALRLALGTSESIAYPAYSRIIAGDFPERHRGFANALVDAGTKTGPALGTLVGGLIVAHYGWRALFLILGFGAMLWLPFWFLSVPRQHKRVVEKRVKGGPGFLEILRLRCAWGTFLGLFCCNYTWYFLLTWLPSYLVMERHYSMSRMAIFGSLPFWGIAASSVSGGWASDRLIERGMTPTRVRRGFAIGGQLMCTLMLPATLISNQVLSMALFIFACLSFGLYTSNLWAITQTLSGREAAGRWTGIQNGLGNLAGVTAPTITGVIVARTNSFFWAFVAVTIVLVVGACSYWLLIDEVAPVRWTARPVPEAESLPAS